VIGGAADQARIALIHANARQAGRIDFHRPAAFGASYEHIGHDVLGRYGVHAGTGSRLASAHQHQREFHFLFRDSQLAPKQRVLLFRDLIEETRGDREGGFPTRRIRIQLA
jgi:hypothetical protein